MTIGIGSFSSLIDRMTARESDIAADRYKVPHDILIVEIAPERKVGIWKRELTEENRQAFIKAMEQIPAISTGLSYVAMAGVHGFHLEQLQTLICQAIGRAFGLWKLYPIDLMPPSVAAEYHRADQAGMFPINTGLVPNDNWLNELYGGDLYNPKAS